MFVARRALPLAEVKLVLGTVRPATLNNANRASNGSSHQPRRERRGFRLTSKPEFKRTPKLEYGVQELDEHKDDRERVVILGSGWAGYTIARRLDPRKYQAVIVSPRSYFVFTPLLASTSVGTLEFRTALEPIRSHRTKATFFQGWADEIDLNHKTLLIEENVDDPKQSMAPTTPDHRHASHSNGGRDLVEVGGKSKKGEIFSLRYDKLVVAVGCYSQTFGTPGVKDHALFLKDVGDARKIRNRLLACFESASLPTTKDTMKKHLLNFAIVGGGPTGIEFSAELHDLIKDDLAKLYPELMRFVNITVYDVAPNVLSMFDKNLGQYAEKSFAREGIKIKTSHHVESLREGVPEADNDSSGAQDSEHTVYTLKLKEQGEVGVGMVVWSTGLCMNPFVKYALGQPQRLNVAHQLSIDHNDSGPKESSWLVKKHAKTGAIITDDRLRVTMAVPPNEKGEVTDPSTMILKDVFAIGDCASQDGVEYPATAQVANQKAEWLAKRLNKGDIEQQAFTWKNMGIMAYIGNWNAIVQTKGGNISGSTAWLIWRGAYLTKSVSFRNKILIPVYWFVNWLFGRDVSRF